jgi:16S rRNA (uracil1498-N3)-methyltransferase
MPRRFFSESILDGPTVWLTGDEALHLLKVLRGQIGDEVLLFDGHGAEHLARIIQRERSRVELELLERREVDRELPFELHLGVALPKGDRQKWLVEKAVELGVSSVTPLITERSVSLPSSGTNSRWQRTILEASKQCGRNRLLELHSAQPWSTFCQQSHPSGLRLVAHPPVADSPCFHPSEVIARRPSNVTVAIGPEGGFSGYELEVAQTAGWQFFSLGRRILRVETACLAIAAFLSTSWDLPSK